MYYIHQSQLIKPSSPSPFPFISSHPILPQLPFPIATIRLSKSTSAETLQDTNVADVPLMNEQNKQEKDGEKRTHG